MNYAVEAAMFGWIPVVLGLFAWLPARRAALAGFLLAWMFLPYAQFRIEGWPDYTKMSATCGGVLLGMAIFDLRRLLGLRWRPADIPVALFCGSAFAASISNGMGVHEGLSFAFYRMVAWAVPYVVGRLYFDDLPQLGELAGGIAAGGLLYVPLCLFELVKGPELHHLIYGYYQPFLDQELRFGIRRPMVFMDSGLMVAVWMSSATVLGIWLWKSGAMPARCRRWAVWLVAVMALTTVALRSVNGWVILGLGAGFLALHTWWKSAAPLVTLAILILAYVTVRAAGLWSGEQSVPVVRTMIDAAKGRSIRFRLQNENIVIANMQQKPVFGWGRGWGATDDHQGGHAVRDSLWIDVFSESGAFGLASIMATLLLPTAIFIRRFPANCWLEGDVAPAAALAIVLVLYTLDNLANGMINPIFMLIAGGLSGLERRVEGPADLRTVQS